MDITPIPAGTPPVEAHFESKHEGDVKQASKRSKGRGSSGSGAETGTRSGDSSVAYAEIYVGNLDLSCNRDNLVVLFETKGHALSKCQVRRPKPRRSSSEGAPSSAYAFVRIRCGSAEEAREVLGRVISELDGVELCGKNIKVEARNVPIQQSKARKGRKASSAAAAAAPASGSGSGATEEDRQPPKKNKKKKKKKRTNTSSGGGNRRHNNNSNNNNNGGIEPAWYPPGAEAKHKKGKTYIFSQEFDPNFHVPRRIADKSNELIVAVNDFHFAMMNDLPRNDFYYEALKQVISEETTLVEIGIGSGLLSMICGSLGAKHVTGIEASKPLANVAMMNIVKNGLQDKISVVNAMSTEIEAKQLKHGKVDVLVSEILGTLLLSENALEFNADAKRLLKPSGKVIPRLGTQFITLIQSDKLDLITSARKWKGLDFEKFNQLKDTASLLFTKELGCRLCTLDPVNMSERLPIIEVDFANDIAGCIASRKMIRTKALRDGVIHAAVFSWEVYSDLQKSHKMSTHYEDTVHNFQRDMQWGQGIQLIEDMAHSDAKEAPIPLQVKAGEELIVEVRIAQEGAIMQCIVRRLGSACGEQPMGANFFSGSATSDNVKDAASSSGEAIA